MAKKIKEVVEPEYLFCSATIRPDCLKETNICCLHCDCVEKCNTISKTAVKPCTTKICGIEEKCEFSL